MQALKQTTPDEAPQAQEQEDTGRPWHPEIPLFEEMASKLMWVQALWLLAVVQKPGSVDLQTLLMDMEPEGLLDQQEKILDIWHATLLEEDTLRLFANLRQLERLGLIQRQPETWVLYPTELGKRFASHLGLICAETAHLVPVLAN